MKRLHRITILLLLLLIGGGTLRAQDHLSVKTNLLYGGYALTPNLGVEVGLSPRWTLEMSGAYNPFNLHGSETDNRKLVHWVAMPEFRYWTCQRFNGHFFGIHGLYGQYNIGGHNLPLLFGRGSDAYRYEGQVLGGGLSYGYSFLLGRRWNLELTIGAGVLYLDYDRYESPKCGLLLESGARKLFFGPTKVGVSLSFLIF